MACITIRATKQCDVASKVTRMGGMCIDIATNKNINTVVTTESMIVKAAYMKAAIFRLSDEHTMTAVATKIDAVITNAAKIGIIIISACRDFAKINVANIGGMVLNASRIGGISCRVEPVCTIDVRGKFLDIEPKILWMWNNPVENDVYSNTDWNIE